jgi:predicted phage tail protein
MTQLIGHKGGSASTPVEAPDSLHSVANAKILDLLCEGPIQGLVDGLRSVYLNETPLANADGTLNFERVVVDVRTGTQEQEHIAGFPAAESEIAVGVELRAETPWVRALTNTSLSAVRVRLGVPQLQQSQDNGDVTGYRIDYAIDVATDGGAYQEVIATAFDGKTTSAYARSHRVELPRAVTGWSVRVRRITPNRNSARIADTVMVQALTEVIDAKLRYPMSALVGLQVDARQFDNIPGRAYRCRLKIVKVPSNYDPASRVYTGVWDGTFKPAWSGNPAWVFYDLVLNDRFGLGHRINASQVDKWALYEIAQYCDVMVSDGKGGQEPRFTVNVYIQTRAAAYKVLQDLAAVFRGMAFYAAGSVVATADMPRDPVFTYTAANVLNGAFTMTGSARSARYTSVNVSWNDPKDFYRAKVAHVEDADGLARYGDRLMEISPLGCTSEAQAQRAGQWVLLTSRLETQALTFSVGLDGFVAMPGQIVRVADPKRMGRRNAGRIRAAAGREVTLDKAPTIAVGDMLTVILPSAVAESRAVVAVDGDSVTVAADWSQLPAAQSVWSVDNIDLVAPLYRILSVREKSGSTFDISATQHEPGKFAAIDTGARIDPRPTTVIPPSVQPPPASVTITSREVIDQGIAVTVMTIAWEAAATAIAYVVEWRRDNGEWVRVQPTGSLNVEVSGVYAGAYTARVRAMNALGVLSSPTTSLVVQLAGNTAAPPAVTALTTGTLTQGIALAWGFPTGPNTIERTEIWYSATPDRSTAIKLSDFAYPQAAHRMMGLAFGVQFFFWARLVDRSGNVGPFYPEGAGVPGSSSSDASEILDGLAGQITRTQLAGELLSAIDDAAGLTAELAELAEQVLAIANGDAELAAEIFASEQRQAQALEAKAAELQAATAAVAEDLQAQADQVAATAAGLADEVQTRAQETADQAALIAANAAAIQQEAAALSAALDAQAGDIAANAAKTAQEIVDRIAQGNTLGGQISSVSSAVGTQATRVDALVSRADGVESSIVTLQQADAGQALRIDALQVRTETLTTRVTETVEATGDLAQKVVGLVAAAADTDSAVHDLAEAGRGYARTLASLRVKSSEAESLILDTREVTAEQATQLLLITTRVGTNESGISTLNQTTATLATRATGLETRASNAEGRIQIVESTTAGQASQLTSLTGRVGGAESGIQTLNIAQAAQASQLTTLQSRADGVDSTITVMSQTQAGQATQLADISTRVGNAEASVTSLSQTSAGYATRIGAVEVKAGDALTRVDQVEEATAENAFRLVDLSAQVGGIDSAITDLSKASEGNAQTVRALRVKSGQAESSIRELNTVTLTQATRQVEMQTKLGTAESNIASLSQTTSTLATQQTSMTARIDGAEGRIANTETVQAQQASRLNTVEVQSGSNTGRIQGLETVTASTATRTDSLEARATGFNASIAALEQVNPELAMMLIEMRAAASDYDSQFSELRKVSADSVSAVRRLQFKSGAAESAIVRVDRVAAGLATSIDQISARTTGVESNLNIESISRASVDGALSSRIDTVTATANGASAAVQTVQQAQATTDGKLNAMYAVKVGVSAGGHLYQAGIGVGVENAPGGMQTQVYALADRFAILNLSNGVVTTPFVIQDGQTIIAQALIGNATITAAKFAEWIESTAVDGYGVPLLRLNMRTGAIYQRSAASGRRIEQENGVIRVYDESNVMRVRMGVW